MLVPGFLFALFLGTNAEASAQLPQVSLPPEWSNSSEFSFIQTRGNTESTTFGLANELITEWEQDRDQAGDRSAAHEHHPLQAVRHGHRG